MLPYFFLTSFIPVGFCQLDQIKKKQSKCLEIQHQGMKADIIHRGRQVFLGKNCRLGYVWSPNLPKFGWPLLWIGKAQSSGLIPSFFWSGDCLIRSRAVKHSLANVSQLRSIGTPHCLQCASGNLTATKKNNSSNFCQRPPCGQL